jgi:hypothetical protein
VTWARGRRGGAVGLRLVLGGAELGDRILWTSGSTWRRPALPPLFGAVPWARRSFTAEFGMGSGGASAL